MTIQTINNLSSLGATELDCKSAIDQKPVSIYFLCSNMTSMVDELQGTSPVTTVGEDGPATNNIEADLQVWGLMALLNRLLKSGATSESSAYKWIMSRLEELRKNQFLDADVKTTLTDLLDNHKDFATLWTATEPSILAKLADWSTSDSAQKILSSCNNADTLFSVITLYEDLELSMPGTKGPVELFFGFFQDGERAISCRQYAKFVSYYLLTNYPNEGETGGTRDAILKAIICNVPDTDVNLKQFSSYLQTIMNSHANAKEWEQDFGTYAELMYWTHKNWSDYINLKN